MCIKFSRMLFPLVVPRYVLAFPLSYHRSTLTATSYVPLIVIAISMFFVLVIVKLVYMKQRRIGTIHAPSTIPAGGGNLSFSTLASFGSRDKQISRHRGLWVGCLGSPSWETTVTSRLYWRRDQEPRRFSIVSQRHSGSTIGSTRFATNSRNASSRSRFTDSTLVAGCPVDADQFTLPLPSGPSRVTTVDNGNSSRSLGPVSRHSRYGDFGESYGARAARGSCNVQQVPRRASPSSIRLVDGPGHSNQVELSFLSGLPPDAIVVSPLMSTRDSIQLSRCSLKCNRKAVPPLPPMPAFLPFHLPKDCVALESYSYCSMANGYLPPLQFSPFVSVSKVFQSRQRVLEPSGQTPDPASRAPSRSHLLKPRRTYCNNTGSLTNTRSFVVQDTPPLRLIRKTSLKTIHERPRSYKGLAIQAQGPLPRVTLITDEVVAVLSPHAKESIQTGVLRTLSGTSGSSSVGSQKPLKSCLRRNSICSPESTLTPWRSGTSYTLRTGRSMTGDHVSLWTPISLVNLGDGRTRSISLDRRGQGTSSTVVSSQER